MPKLRRVSGQEVIRALERLGFVQARQRGSHVVLKKQTLEGEVGCAVPLHRELAIGISRVSGGKGMPTSLKVGDIAPELGLKDANGQVIRLKYFKGKKSVILNFYPKNDTPEWIEEARLLQSHLEQIKQMDTVVMGVSVDSPKSHRQFKEKYGITFYLLSDATKEVSRRYGVLTDQGYLRRTTFVMDRGQVIVAIYPDSRLDGRIVEVLAVLRPLGAVKH